MALAKAGFTVKAVCPPGHPLGKTGAVEETYPYRGLAPISSFLDAIAAADPDIFIPGDDLASQHLHEVYFLNAGANGDKRVCALIERSLGSPESFALLQGRAGTIELARAEGVRVPKTEIIPNLEALRNWCARKGFPVVLKADGSSGGDGVRIARTIEEAERAFRSLSAPKRLMRAAKRAFANQDTTLVWPSLLRRRPAVNAQVFVAGREATSMVVCWQGSVLAALHCEVIKKENSTGPATVLQFIEDAEMSAAAQKIARRLKLSGVHGFDFMRESQTGDAYLIEINPRATQIGHLTFGPGRDLPAALYSAVSGEALQPAPVVTDKEMVALFPQEWIRDSSSPYLRSAYHDVPWDEAELVRACIRSHRPQIPWYSAREELRAFRELLSTTFDGSTGGPRWSGSVVK